MTVKVTGDCNLTGTGNFEGSNQWQDYGDVKGNLSGTCKYNGDNVSVEGNFHGFVYLNKGRADGTWGGKTTSKIHVGKSGIWEFNFELVN